MHSSSSLCAAVRRSRPFLRQSTLFANHLVSVTHKNDFVS